eukprot:5027764-Pleurochrysis_carterae.AAC.1
MAGGSKHPRGCAISGADIAQPAERRDVDARRLPLVLKVDMLPLRMRELRLSGRGAARKITPVSKAH